MTDSSPVEQVTPRLPPRRKRRRRRLKLSPKTLKKMIKKLELRLFKSRAKLSRNRRRKQWPRRSNKLRRRQRLI